MTDGPTDQPTPRSASLRRARSPADAGEVVVEDRRVAQRLGDERDRHGRHRAGRPVRVEPGDQLGAGDREPDPQAGQRVGLARGPDDDEVRVGVAQPDERRPDELGVGLVEDDDRCRTAGRGRILGETVEEVADRAVRLGQRGRVVRAAQPDDRRVRAAARADGVQVERPAGLLAAPRRPPRPVRRAARSGPGTWRRSGSGRRPDRRPGG